MLLHNFLEYNDNYAMTSGGFWNYHRNEVNDALNENNVAKIYRIRVATHSWIPWIVLEFFWFWNRSWKIPYFGCCSWNVLENSFLSQMLTRFIVWYNCHHLIRSPMFEYLKIFGWNLWVIKQLTNDVQFLVRFWLVFS